MVHLETTGEPSRHGPKFAALPILGLNPGFDLHFSTRSASFAVLPELSKIFLGCAHNEWLMIGLINGIVVALRQYCYPRSDNERVDQPHRFSIRAIFGAA